jgi:hypothetical protein
MKRLITLCAVAVCLPGFPAASQDAESDSEVMKKWKEYSSPGERHKVLDQIVGKWTTSTKVFPTGPDSPSNESVGTSECKWILGKRHIQQQSQGTMLGLKVESVGFFGYDNFKRKYTCTWMESTSTARYTAEGTIDQTGKKITMHGHMDEFLTGEHDKIVRYELNLMTPDTFSFKIFDLGLGNDSLVVEVNYTRVKD